MLSIEFTNKLLSKYSTSLTGLTNDEASKRLEQYGLNIAARNKQKSYFIKFLENFKNPLTNLLLALALISYITHDVKSAITMCIMVFLTIFIKFFQEVKGDLAAKKLASLILPTATVIRDGLPVEVDVKEIVPGDIVHLESGSMVPADIQLLKSKDLFVNQIILTGESLPAEKLTSEMDYPNIFENPNLCFMGTNVESGTAEGVVTGTGFSTQIGILSKNITAVRPVTDFDKGITTYTWFMIKLILILGLIVFVINGVIKNEWVGALMYAVAVAVGLTPEMLPTIVTVNLSKGAVLMHRRKVIIKNLNSIQSFGAMDILCTDKTGTLTNGKILLQKHMDCYGTKSDTVFNYAYLNSYFQTGVKNMLDDAVLSYSERMPGADNVYKKLDEIPFDFVRKRMSVIVKNDKNIVLICKGAFEEVSGLCDKYEMSGNVLNIDDNFKSKAKNLIYEQNSNGFRMVAVAYKIVEPKESYSVSDENDMVLCGFLAFLDAAKDSAAEAIKYLNSYNVSVKVLTGDNDVVTRKICSDVGIPVDKVILGKDIDLMNNAELRLAVEHSSIFAKLTPEHKKKVITALRENGHVVGFMGDGINDAPALKQADVGISVDTAADIAKDTSDIILLEKNLLILKDGVLEGRKVFANIIKYIRMAASSNFGNMISVVGASLIVPFVPMMPIQVLTNNMLYDFSQTTLPTDNVDECWLQKPRRWEIKNIWRYIYIFGPVSSIFDYLTFFILLYFYNGYKEPSVFQTGWFLESLLTQTLIIHVLRTNKVPFIKSRASMPLVVTTLFAVIAGIVLVYSPVAENFGFVLLPITFFIPMTLFMIIYTLLTQAIKQYYIKKFDEC